ncbi:LexA family protein [Enterovibrio norvegicus]|uniref:LexA family protein n=1 Tax=Enterovibrio norvegicus TaxID=188144 RepID=UPI00354D709C
MEIGKVLREARKKKGLTLRTVAEETGVKVTTQSNIELGEVADPGFNSVSKLAHFYGISLDKLYQVGLEQGSEKLAAARMQDVFPIPVLSSVQAGRWTEYLSSEEDFDVVFSPYPCPKSCFALNVVGDSMTAPSGSRYSFPDGSRVIVNPEREPHNKDFVVVRLIDSDECTFKKLVLDSGQTYLAPLNPQYPMIKVDREMQIVGVVVTQFQSVEQ